MTACSRCAAYTATVSAFQLATPPTPDPTLLARSCVVDAVANSSDVCHGHVVDDVATASLIVGISTFTCWMVVSCFIGRLKETPPGSLGDFKEARMEESFDKAGVDVAFDKAGIETAEFDRSRRGFLGMAAAMSAITAAK